MNPLYNELSSQKVNPQDALRELVANPAQMIQRAGYSVPANLARNPQAAVMHILQSGQINSPTMNLLARMMGRR